MRVNFQITDQQHEWVFGAQGGRTGQWVISFQTSEGWASQVVVPDSAYTPHNVAVLIGEEAARIDAVGNVSAVEIG